MLLEEDRHYLERLVGLYHNYGEDVGSAEMQRIAGGMLERLHSGALGGEDYAWLLARVRNQMEAVAGMGDPEDPERQGLPGQVRRHRRASGRHGGALKQNEAGPWKACSQTGPFSRAEAEPAVCGSEIHHGYQKGQKKGNYPERPRDRRDFALSIRYRYVIISHVCIY